jgi:3-oxoadipate CoA-transferase alpha subunit
MLDKTVPTLLEAVRGVQDGATISIGGFGNSGTPTQLVQAVLETGARDLVIVNNNAGNGQYGLSELIEAGRVRKVICTFARSANSKKPNALAFLAAYNAGKIEFECVPQGTMAARLHAAGSGLGPFFTPTSYGTKLAAGKETRVIDGIGYVLEHPLHTDFALVKAHQADRWGNLTYRFAGRNFGPVMCMAAKTAVVQVDEIVPLGSLPPEQVVTSGIFVQRVVQWGGSHVGGN